MHTPEAHELTECLRHQLLSTLLCIYYSKKKKKDFFYLFSIAELTGKVTFASFFGNFLNKYQFELYHR